MLPSRHDTLPCIAIQIPQRPAFPCHDTMVVSRHTHQPSSTRLSRYTNCIVTLSQASQAFGHDTISCITTQFPPTCLTFAPVTIQQLYRDTISQSFKPPQPRYKICIVTRLFPLARPVFQPLGHDIIHCIVTHMGSSPFPFSATPFFFFLFSHIYIFFLHSTGKHPKKYISFFFSSFSSTPNKFIKIYFI